MIIRRAAFCFLFVDVCIGAIEGLKKKNGTCKNLERVIRKRKTKKRQAKILCRHLAIYRGLTMMCKHTHTHTHTHYSPLPHKTSWGCGTEMSFRGYSIIMGLLGITRTPPSWGGAAMCGAFISGWFIFLLSVFCSCVPWISCPSAAINKEDKRAAAVRRLVICR